PSASPPQRSTRSSALACTATSAHTIAAAFMKPSEDFIRREPYFTIVTDPRLLSANRTAEAEREFFQSGENDVAEIFDIARLRVPGANALANLARRKPLDTPLIPTTTYDIAEIASVIRQEGCSDPYLVFTRHGDADAVVLYTRRPPRRDEAPAARDESFVDVRDLIDRNAIENLNRTAYAYFQSLAD